MVIGSFGQNHEKMQNMLKIQAGSMLYTPLSTSYFDIARIHVVLETPDFGVYPTTQEKRDRSTHYANYKWAERSKSVTSIPFSGEIMIPDGVVYCELSLISCRIPISSWDPIALLHFLFREGYVNAELDSSFDDSRRSGHLPLENIRVMSSYTASSPNPRFLTQHPTPLTSDGIAAPPAPPANGATPLTPLSSGGIAAPPDSGATSPTPLASAIGRSALSRSKSMRSFVTARSQMSTVSTRSSHGNSAFFSVLGVDSASMMRTIREDETPSSGLSARLAQIHNDYYTTLHHQEIIQPFEKELNWSGKGQHVAFEPKAEIPLFSISLLGSSHTATVDKVICRRIALARKTMECNGRWTVADALREVRHLQNLRHFHVVQLVGTYLQGRMFSILMYPVADSHLGTFLEETLDMPSSEQPAIGIRQQFLASVLPCLTSALVFVHKNTTKHMDIKPQNILVRNANFNGGKADWRVYLADFGLSRNFASQDHSETDGPTSRTPRYCSPEVYDDEPRGRAADIFSLGCVFLEISCVIAGTDPQDFAVARRGASSDESFHANIDRVVVWTQTFLYGRFSSMLSRSQSDTLLIKAIVELLTSMVRRDPGERPTATEVYNHITNFPRSIIPINSCCSLPPEPYERYKHPGLSAKKVIFTL